MVRTRVGYAGGTKNDPTYTSLGDHSEAVQIDYDPSRISYQELLDIFWSSHSPTLPAWSTQYASLILYHDDHQEELARKSMEREETKLGRRLYTEIVPYSSFYRAEDYHQKYRLRRESELLRELEAFYTDYAGFVDSTAAARLNGFLGGNGTAQTLAEEIDSYGLSPEGKERLLELTGLLPAGASCPVPK